MRIRLQFVAAFLAPLLLISCSQGPQKTLASSNSEADTTAASSGPVSAKTAFWEMYRSAHTWAPDLMPLSLESKAVPGVKNNAGDAEVWSATFGSLSKHEARTFSYAVAAHPPDIPKGITVGNGIPWGGPSRDAMPFASDDLKVDSDAAYKAAYAKAAPWIEKHPDKQATLTLGNASRYPAPVWYVLWGDKKLGYAVYVNAKTGAVLK